MVDERARTAAEQLDGVREGGGHDRPAAGDGIHENTGRHLVFRVVGQHDQRRRLDHRRQHRGVVVPGIDGHTVRHPGVLRPLDERVAVGLAVGGLDIRVRPTYHQVARPAGHRAQRHHGVDDPLDALPRAQQAPRQEGGSARTRPLQLRSHLTGLGGHRSGQPWLRQNLAQRQRQRIRIVMVDERARTAAEQLDGVREGGGHDRPAAGDGIHENTGRHLVFRVVGQHDQRRRLDHRRQHRGVVVPGIDGHTVRHPGVLRPLDERVAVGLAVGGLDIRVRPTYHQVARPAGHRAQRHHGVDDPLDALPRAQQAPRQEGGSARTLRAGAGRDRRAVRNRHDLALIDSVRATQALPRRF